MVMQAPVLNNLAVACLQLDEWKEGMNYLRIAISSLKSEMEQNRERPSSLHTNHFLEDHSSRRSVTTGVKQEVVCTETTNFLQSTPVYVSSEQVHPPQSCIEIFSHALVVSHAEEDRQELVCAVVLYNMGLVHHLVGLADPGQKGERKLENALLLYELALRLLHASQTELDAEVKILALALENNLAHLHSLKFSMDEAQRSLHEVRNLLASRKYPTALDEEEYKVFFLNTLWGKQMTAFAPAA